MKPIELFLKYPNLFYSGLAAEARTISLVETQELGRVFTTHETNYTPIDGIFLSWGTSGEPRGGGYYYRRQDKANIVTRKITNFKNFGTGNNSYSFTISDQIKIKYGKSTWSYSTDNSANFAILAANDVANVAYLSAIPELKESFGLFARETANWWDGHRNPNVRNNAPQRLVDVTDIISNSAAEQACKNLDKLSDPTLLNQTKREIQTHKIIGFFENGTPHIYRTRTDQDPITTEFSNDWIVEETSKPTTIRSWKANKSQNHHVELGNEALPVRVITPFKRAPFDVHLEMGTLEDFDIRFHAHFTWIAGKFNADAKITSRMNEYTRKSQKTVTTVKKRMFLPVITGIVMELCPKVKTGTHHLYEWHDQQWSDDQQLGMKMNSEESNPYNFEEITRVRDATKKRAIKGAYRGGYQGISKLSYNGKLIMNNVMESGLSAIAKGPPITSYKLDIPKRMPLSLEDFKKIERPKVDIKPIEIGHLRFYRLSTPPKRHITADILSDLLLPSMPELLIATDSHIRVTQADNFVGGEHCSGKCCRWNGVAEKGRIDSELPPGLYLVNRHEKCALGHDPGRTEYTSGFGDISNETITVRRLLSQLKVSYDQFRANMVSNNQTDVLTPMTESDNSAFFGRL